MITGWLDLARGDALKSPELLLRPQSVQLVSSCLAPVDDRLPRLNCFLAPSDPLREEGAQIGSRAEVRAGNGDAEGALSEFVAGRVIPLEQILLVHLCRHNSHSKLTT